MLFAVCLSVSIPISLVAMVRGVKLDNSGLFVDGLPSFAETKR